MKLTITKKNHDVLGKHSYVEWRLDYFGLKATGESSTDRQALRHAHKAMKRYHALIEALRSIVVEEAT